MFVWWQFVDVDLSSETIKNVNIRKIYFNEIEDKDNIFTSDKKDLGETVKRAKEEYQEMVNLRDNNTISEHLFNLWISDKVQQLDKQYRLLSNQTLKNLKKMDKDLEKSIKQKEGETNGNRNKFRKD